MSRKLWCESRDNPEVAGVFFTAVFRKKKIDRCSQAKHRNINLRSFDVEPRDETALVAAPLWRQAHATHAQDGVRVFVSLSPIDSPLLASGHRRHDDGYAVVTVGRARLLFCVFSTLHTRVYSKKSTNSHVLAISRGDDHQTCAHLHTYNKPIMVRRNSRRLGSIPIHTLFVVGSN